MRCKKNSGQVWVETVVYTLIALLMIGLVLTFAKPKIEELQDKAIIEQSVNMLEDIDSIIQDIKIAPGNKREVGLGLKKGELSIDGQNDKLVFSIDSKHTYSEPGEEYEYGHILVYTEEVGKINKVNLTRDYSETYNIQWEERDELKLISKSSTNYRIFVSNIGEDESGKIKINFEFV